MRLKARLAALVFSPAVFVAAAGLARAAGTPEEVLRAKKHVAHECVKQAKALAGRKCYFTLAEHLKLGLLFVPDDRELGSMTKIYAFVPELPPVKGPPSAGALPLTGDFERRKPDLEADAAALTDFFANGLDALLVTFVEKLQPCASDASLAPHAAREIVALLETAEKRQWRSHEARPGFGVPRFEAAASGMMSALGWELRPPWPGGQDRWYSAADIEGEKEIDLSRAKERLEAAKSRVMPEKAAALDTALPVEPVSEASPFEEGLGISLNKLRSAHFQAEAHFPEEALRRVLAAQEAGLARLTALLKIDLPERFENPVKTVLLQNSSLYSKYVMEMTAGSREEKEWTAKKTGSTLDPGRDYWVRTAPVLSPHVMDGCVACPLRLVMRRFGFKKLPYWIKFGLEAKLTLDVLGTADTSYVSMKETTGRGKVLLGFNYYWWTLDVKRLESARRAPSTDAILAFSNVNEMIAIQRAKMYCLVDFFLRNETERFKRLLAALSGSDWVRGKDGEFTALKEAGWTLRELDEAFRKDLLEGR